MAFQTTARFSIIQFLAKHPEPSNTKKIFQMPEEPKVKLMYYITKYVLYLFFRVRFCLTIKNRHNVPANGACIIASNHASNLDPILIGAVCPVTIFSMAKAELFEGRLRNWFFRAVNAIPVERGKGDVKSIKTLLKLLKSGTSVQIFPEGTRSPDGTLRKANPGIGMLVEKAGVPVVPCFINGTFEALAKGAQKLSYGKLDVVFGSPITFEKAATENKKEHYQLIGDTIMGAIAELKKEHTS